MNSSLSASEVFKLIGGYSSADCYARPASEVYAGAIRLESGFYGSDGYRAVRAMKKSGFELGVVGQFAKVRWFGPFARTYVADRSAGVAFLSSADMMCARLEPKNYLSKELTRNLERLLVSDGTILISCSGTIGNVVMCTKDYDNVAVSQHAIRVNALEEDDMGYLYAFLQSEPGQFLVTRNKSGSVIESIYETDVSSLTIPILPKALRQELTRLIRKANTLRGKANALLTAAGTELQETCKLPNLAELKVNNLVKNDGEATIFSCNLSKAVKLGNDFNTLRLDSTFYNPKALKARLEIGSKKRWTTVEEGSEEVILLGKTFVPGVHKVDKEVGIPYFTGKELFKFRQSPETYITCQKKQILEKLTVKAGTVLITCAGTVGKVMYVKGALANTAITHDAIRVISSANKLHSGYLYAFLVSEYGKIQLDQCSYGSVIPRLYSDHIKNIMLPEPQDKGKSIGEKVDQAFDCRTEAFNKEEQAIVLFMSAILDGKDAVESKWGRDY